jgi:SOS-response transcriptional repressor LexA
MLEKIKKTCMKSLHRKENMALNLVKLTKQLEEINDPGLYDLKDQIIAAFDDQKKMRAIISQQCRNRGKTHCLSCDNEGDCFILNGIIYLQLNETKKAIKELENANQHLRGKDEIWNSIIGLVLLGLACEQSRNSHQALIEYKKALHLLKEKYIRLHMNDYDRLEMARTLETELNAQVTQLSSPRPAAAPQAPANLPVAKPGVNSVESLSAYLSFVSMPIYGTVRAGADGELHINPAEKSFTIVNKVELEDQLFDVFSVGHTLSRDRKITLNSQESYGWAKVLGKSMNGWDTPLNENDFVLFRENQTANDNDFVVVSSRDSFGNFMYIVKKYDGFDRQFLSKSTDTSQSYDPIPMDKDHKIFGVVIAVAKPPVK